MPLRFYKRPTWLPMFANRRKSKENFCCYEGKKKKGEKQEALGFCFAASLVITTAENTPCSAGGTTKHLRQEPCSASQHQAPTALTESVVICALSQFSLCIPGPDASCRNCFFALHHFRLQNISCSPFGARGKPVYLLAYPVTLMV